MTKTLQDMKDVLKLWECSSLRGLPIGNLKEMFVEGKPKQSELN
jgi:hypothetical protein